MSLLEFTYRIIGALLAGILIGIERQWHHKAAGLRTVTLVTVGSALYVTLSISLTPDNGDVTRIIGQVVTGIGFIGGGIIFKEGLNVHGLTTAATVWCCSAIGCLVGAGYYWESIISTALILIINTALIPLDKWLNK